MTMDQLCYLSFNILPEKSGNDKCAGGQFVPACILNHIQQYFPYLYHFIVNLLFHLELTDDEKNAEHKITANPPQQTTLALH